MPHTSRKNICANFVCLAVALLLPAAVSAATATFLPPFELREAPESLALTLSLSDKPVNLRTFILQEPDRLVLDISPARTAAPLAQESPGNTLIHRVRAAQFTPGTVRVVFDLRRSIHHEVTSQPASRSGSPHRIVVRLRPLAGDQNREARIQVGALHEQASREDTKNNAPVMLPEVGEPTLTPGSTGDAAKISAEPPWWGAVDLSGHIRAKVAQQFQQTSDPDRLFRSTLHLEAKLTPPGSSNTYVLGSLQPDYLWFGPTPSNSDLDPNIHEAYLFHSAEHFELRLGRQIVRWGKTDQISPVDNINPQDMREFVIPDLEERKIPNWMARARAFPVASGPFDSVTLETIFVPFFREDKYDWDGGTWALLRGEHLGLRVVEETPTRNLGNADYGLRVAASAAGWDLALSWLQATEKTPRLSLASLDPMSPTLLASYGRQNIYGFEFETTLQKLGFRGEVAYMNRQSLNTENFSPVSSPVVSWVLGLDYSGEADWYANIQISHQHVFQYDSNILYLDQNNFYLNGEIHREFQRGDVMFKFAYAVSLGGNGAFITPEAIWKAIENFEISLGANYFFGPEDSYFGRYRENDQGFFKGTYHF